MSKVNLAKLTEKLEQGESLDEGEARGAAFSLAAKDSDLKRKRDFLVALTEKGESPMEVSTFASTFRELAIDPGLDEYKDRAIDVCGTGGDKSGSFNISTTTAMILAAAGVPVFKHGNRSITSGCGSADLLERLGVSLQGVDGDHARALEELRFTFFFAPSFHPAFKEIMPVRKALGAEGIRTIFNLLGPLINPGRPAYQLLGVFSLDLVEPVAVALDALGLKRGLVVHTVVNDRQGMDELSCCGLCHVAGFGEFSEVREIWEPEELNLNRCSLSDVQGGDLDRNMELLGDVLAGGVNPGLMDSICLNAGAALWIAEVEPNLSSGVARARSLLSDGTVKEWLGRMQAFFAS